MNEQIRGKLTDVDLGNYIDYKNGLKINTIEMWRYSYLSCRKRKWTPVTVHMSNSMSIYYDENLIYLHHLFGLTNKYLIHWWLHVSCVYVRRFDADLQLQNIFYSTMPSSIHEVNTTFFVLDRLTRHLWQVLAIPQKFLTHFLLILHHVMMNNFFVNITIFLNIISLNLKMNANISQSPRFV